MACHNGNIDQKEIQWQVGTKQEEGQVRRTGSNEKETEVTTELFIGQKK